MKENAERTEKGYRWYRDYLADFARRFGKVLAKDLVELPVDRWLNAHPN